MTRHVACVLLALAPVLAARSKPTWHGFHSPSVSVCQNPRFTGSSPSECTRFRDLAQAEAEQLVALLITAEAGSTPLAKPPQSFPPGPTAWGISMSEEHLRGGGSASIYFTLYLSPGFMSAPLSPSHGYVSLTPAAAKELQAYLIGLFNGRPAVAA